MIAIVATTHGVAEELPPASVDTTIARGLEFLATQQNPDGSFGASGKQVTTGLALLSFLSCGHTPNAGKFDANVGKFGSNVRAAIDYLLAQAQPDGSFGGRDKPMLEQAIVTLALAEAYGVDDNEAQRKRLAGALAASAKLIVSAQEPRKGDASPGGRKTDGFPPDLDLSLCKWMLTALRACQDVGISVPKPVFQRTAKFVLKCFNPGEKAFAPQPGSPVTASATAAGLLCLRLLDLPKAAAVDAAATTLPAHAPDDPAATDISYSNLYFSAQAAFWADDSTSPATVKATFDKLSKLQQADGGWPDGAADPIGSGRSYSTAMTLLTLSIPYRLLPADQR